jgi:hypothetical protein
MIFLNAAFVVEIVIGKTIVYEYGTLGARRGHASKEGLDTPF